MLPPIPGLMVMIFNHPFPVDCALLARNTKHHQARLHSLTDHHQAVAAATETASLPPFSPYPLLQAIHHFFLFLFRVCVFLFFYMYSIFFLSFLAVV